MKWQIYANYTLLYTSVYACVKLPILYANLQNFFSIFGIALRCVYVCVCVCVIKSSTSRENRENHHAIKLSEEARGLVKKLPNIIINKSMCIT